MTDRPTLSPPQLPDVGTSAHPARVLILYGSLRSPSYSRFAAEQAAVDLEALGAEVRWFHPRGLPSYCEDDEAHPKVVELRELALWAEAHLWSVPEYHGTMSGLFKNQIDWLPATYKGQRTTEGCPLALLQVCGGGRSVNTLNSMRLLGCWMKMLAIPSQASVGNAWKAFDDEGGMEPGTERDRITRVSTELVKYTLLTRDVRPFLSGYPPPTSPSADD